MTKRGAERLKIVVGSCIADVRTRSFKKIGERTWEIQLFKYKTPYPGKYTLKQKVTTDPRERSPLV